MRKLWIFRYVVNDNNTGNELMSIEDVARTKEEAMKMLESKYAEDASEFEITEGFFSMERAWHSTESLHMEYAIRCVVY
jgi:hypothetical protein